MNRNYFYIFSVVFAALVIIGCSGGNSHILENLSYEIITPAQQVEIDGTTKIETGSGLKFVADQENTFDSNVFIQITEKDLTQSESKYFNNASRLYTISAKKKIIDTLGMENTIDVTNVEKPVLLTIPNKTGNKEGTYFIGYRTDKDHDWQYSIINSQNSEHNPMAFSARLSQSNYQPEFYVKTYDVNMQFMLFMVAPNTQISKAVISDFAVNDNKPLKIKTEHDNYSEDLKIKINLTGDNLSKLKPADISVCISFFNNDSTEYPSTLIPVTGASLKTDVSLKDACAGNRYIHTMTLSNITDFSSDQLSFAIRLRNISKEIFPPSFNITLCAKDTEGTLAYKTTKEIKLETQPQEDLPTQEISIVATNPENGSQNITTDASSVITVTFEQELNSNTDWSKFVTLTNGSDALPLTFDYSNKTLTIHHNGLDIFTEYTVLIANGIKGVEPHTETVTMKFSFTTINAETEYVKALLTAPAEKTNVPVDSQIIVTFSDEIAWNDACKELVVLSQAETPLGCNYSYSDKVLTIQPTAGLLYDKNYTITISEKLSPVGKYQKFEGNKTFTFTTQSLETTPQISSASTKAINNKYYLVAGQEFTVNFNKPIVNESTAKASITLKKNDTEFSGFSVSDFDTTKKVVRVTLSDALEANGVYSISVANFVDDDNSKILSISEAFNALPDIEILNSSIASGSADIPIEGNIVVEFSEKVTSDAIKLVDSDGNEITTGITYITTGKSNTIELSYKLNYFTKYGILTEYKDTVTGQSLEKTILTFTTVIPDEPVLLNPEAANSTENPYLIYTARALDKVRNILSAHYQQMADIDMASYISENYTDDGWLPIGNEITAFTGSFDGNSFKIKNLSCNRLSSNYCGMFGCLNGELSNITLETNTIAGNNSCGGLVGNMIDGTISNCNISSNIVECNGGIIGGMIGVMQNGNIKKCSIEGNNVTGNQDYIGGFVGEIQGGSIEFCIVNTGTVISSLEFAGGFLGHATGGSASISNCNVKLDTVSALQKAGGFAGESTNTVFDTCTVEITNNLKSSNPDSFNSMILGGFIAYSNGDKVSKINVTVEHFVFTEDCSAGTAGEIGGLIGRCENSEISGCTITMDSFGDNRLLNNFNIGGLIGYSSNSNYYVIKNCSVVCNSISFRGYGHRLGGLIGYAGSNVYVFNCFTDVKFENNNALSLEIGGLIGVLGNGYSEVNNCYSNISIINSDGKPYSIGGLIGIMNYEGALVSDCYANGSIINNKESNTYIGGLIGYAYGPGSSGTVMNSYSNCSIQNASGDIYGSLLGYVDESSLPAQNCFATKPKTENGNNLWLIGGDTSGSTVYRAECYEHNYISADGYLSIHRQEEFYDPKDWDSTIWDDLDTATPKLRNVGSQS